ncbi:flagellar basal body-associated FliL family protein [Aliikangiella coralliicola]|nr:flagellar basal body-associated FliL family protein [Aliikangiella coralliicola]
MTAKSAEETATEEPEENKLPLMYYQIAPNILTFYQSTGRKIGYIVVQVQIVVRGQDDFDLIDLHLPLMQDALIDFFNRQDKKTIEDLTQRESLRQQATQRIAEVIQDEVGRNIVENVLFTQYVFQ